MRLLVCGSRYFQDYGALCSVLNELSATDAITCVIHGSARGADTLGGQWAEDHAIPVLAFPADWKRYGKAAGPIRNQQLLNEGRPDYVVAFPLSHSTGTWDMVRRARKALGEEKVKVVGARRSC